MDAPGLTVTGITASARRALTEDEGSDDVDGISRNEKELYEYSRQV